MTETNIPEVPPPPIAIVEQFGHRRFGAKVRLVTMGGVKLLELTVLNPDATKAPLLVTTIASSSVFAITACSEVVARQSNRMGLGLGFGERELGAGDTDEAQDPFDDADDGPTPLDRATSAAIMRLNLDIDDPSVGQLEVIEGLLRLVDAKDIALNERNAAFDVIYANSYADEPVGIDGARYQLWQVQTCAGRFVDRAAFRAPRYVPPQIDEKSDAFGALVVKGNDGPT